MCAEGDGAGGINELGGGRCYSEVVACRELVAAGQQGAARFVEGGEWGVLQGAASLAVREGETATPTLTLLCPCP